MQKPQKDPKSHFKVFVDEHSPEESQTIEEQWQKTKKKQRNKQLTTVLVIGAVTIGLIFAILLNVFLTHKPSHRILDYSDPDYTYIQTTFPHIKVLVSNQADTYEAKVLRAIGIHQPELVSWIQGNVAPSMKVLLLPDQSSGSNLFGMTLAFYLHSNKQGRLDMLITDQKFRQMTNKNLALAKDDYITLSTINLLDKQSQFDSTYDLVIVQNQQSYQSMTTGVHNRLVIIRKQKDSSNTLNNLFGQYISNQITGGSLNDRIKVSGKGYGYALRQIRTTEKQSFKVLLLQKNNQQSVNLCPEAAEEFRGKEYLRNLVQYFRNKTASTIYYALDNEPVYSMIQKFNRNKQIVRGLPNQIDLKDISQPEMNYFIVNFQGAQGLRTAPSGTLLVEVQNSQQANTVSKQFKDKIVSYLPTSNNNGCFYPPQLTTTSYQTPHFVILFGL